MAYMKKHFHVRVDSDMNSPLKCRFKELFGGSASSEWVASMGRERYTNGPGSTISRKTMKAVGMKISDTPNKKRDSKSEIVKTFEASGMTPKFHEMIAFASGKRKQQDDSTSGSQSKSATRTTLASGTSGRGLSTSQITSGVSADNFSELEDKYDNQLMSTMTADDVYWWLMMRGMEPIQGIPKRIYSTDHLEVSDLSTTKQESSVAPGNDLIMMKGGEQSSSGKRQK
jgi:hypothetical protein